MNIFRPALAGAIAAVLLSGATLAAAPDLIDPPASKKAPAAIGALDYRLETEMTVENWVLCVSRPFAESIVKARAEGADKALAAYAGLKLAKSCGQFRQLRVILHEPVYQSEPGAGHNSRVYSAAVNIAGAWADAYLVYGGLPEN